jgi:uncharacterized oxidoreductase
MDINGHTIFIPGATSGIGLALAIALQDKGNTVVVGGRRTELLEQIRADHGLATLEIDVADAESIAAAAKAVIADHPDLDVLVTMAGIMRAEDLTRSGFADGAEEIITTNLLGTIRLVDAFIDHLRTRPSATIMTVSSGLAFTPLRPTPTYNATKAAIHMLSETLRLQLAHTTVDVVELVPPAVATDLIPGHRDNPVSMPLDEYVDEVLSLVESRPEATEILVERVKFLRYGEARGDYAQVVATLNAQDHNG